MTGTLAEAPAIVTSADRGDELALDNTARMALDRWSGRIYGAATHQVRARNERPGATLSCSTARPAARPRTYGFT